MKIMIVDDEAIVRIGMKTMVDWNVHGHTIVAEAGDGESAFELAKKHNPDIILVDIIMPKMSGLELIEKMQKEQLTVKFIILSCMDELEYLRKALSLGVSEYFLKNMVNPEKLIEVVNRVSDTICRERVFDLKTDIDISALNQYVVLNEFANQVIKNNIRDEDVIKRKIKSFGLGMSCDNLYVMACSFIPVDVKEDSNENYLHAITNICQGIIDSITEGYVFINYEDIITIILNNFSGKRDEDFFSDITFRMTESINQYFDGFLKIGISPALSLWSGLSSGYSEAVHALELSFYDKESLVFYSDALSVNEQAAKRAELLLKDILNISNICSMESATEYIGELGKSIVSGKNLSADQARHIYFRIYLHIHELALKEKIDAKDTGINAANDYIYGCRYFEDMHDYVMETAECIRELKEHKDMAEKLDVICIIQKYIKENMDKKIKLSELSDLVHFNSDYLCRYFSKKTNQSLISYIKKVKMENARKLVEAGLSNSEIIDKIGYSSTSYFIKDFKAFTGVTPRKYKQ